MKLHSESIYCVTANGWGGHICPPQVSGEAGYGLWFQIFVATLYLTQIDTRDLPFSDA